MSYQAPQPQAGPILNYFRHSAETRPCHPDAAGPAHGRALEMAEAMREILFRDGQVTETALVAQGFTAGEIVEYAADARRHANLVLTVAGQRFDRIPDVIDKAVAAIAHVTPVMAGIDDRAALTASWRGYCAAIAAHRLDPWVSQTERCINRLKIFLDRMPLLESEKNKVITAVAGALKRRVAAA